MSISVSLSKMTVKDVTSALHRVPVERLPDILQFIEFVQYQAALDMDDSAEDEALWAAVEANQAYKRLQPDEERERYDSGTDFLKAVADL